MVSAHPSQGTAAPIHSRAPKRLDHGWSATKTCQRVFRDWPEMSVRKTRTSSTPKRTPPSQRRSGPISGVPTKAAAPFRWLSDPGRRSVRCDRDRRG
jgi:hypothetical protein